LNRCAIDLTLCKLLRVKEQRFNPHSLCSGSVQ
jgi:hypothetical protein